MRATTLFCTFAALSCRAPDESPEVSTTQVQRPQRSQGPKGPPLDDRGRPKKAHEPTMVKHCQDYKELPEVYGFCLSQVAGRGQGKATADEICRTAGTWESECRTSWVASRSGEHSPWDLQVLLDACPRDKGDCRFEVLDSRPHQDVMVQVERCFQNARSYSGDCIAHALDRWVRGRPGLAEIERVAQLNIAPDRVGSYLFAIMSCYGTIDACLGSPKVKEACLNSERDQRRDPVLCERLLQSPAIPQVPMGP